MKRFVLLLTSLFILSGCNSEGVVPTPTPTPSLTPSEDISLSRISLSGSYQTEFSKNESFTYSGLIVTAFYSDSSSKEVSNYTVTTPDMTLIGDQDVYVLYSENNKSVSEKYIITIRDISPSVYLTEIVLSGDYEREFFYGESVSTSGLVVTAKYSDNSSKVVTNYQVSINNEVVSITYTEKNVTKTASYNIVIRKELRRVFNETYIHRQTYLNNIGDIFTTWKYYRGRGVTIAVIDKAFDIYHEDFIDIYGNSKIDDKSAYISFDGSRVNTSVGKSYVHDLSDSHGTFCAGVASASLNGKGVIGIAPEAKLLLIKVDGKPTSIAAAFKYAADNGAKVITISIGSYYETGDDLIDDGTDPNTVYTESVNYCINKGVVICSAAGNGGGYRPTDYTYPGSVAGIIGCGGLAYNETEEIWSGSSYNSSPSYQFVDVFAPSENMFGICNFNRDGKHFTYDGGWEGTSFSSPIVAGMAALYFEKYPNNSGRQFESALYASCHKLTRSSIASSSQLGYGRVDVSSLLGIERNYSVTLKVKSNWSNMYVYAWNSDLSLNKQIAAWPGVRMSYSSGTFTYNVNVKDYDFVIFNNGSGSQTINIQSSSFNDGKTYNIDGFTDRDLYVGSYI